MKLNIGDIAKYWLIEDHQPVYGIIVDENRQYYLFQPFDDHIYARSWLYKDMIAKAL